MILLDLPEYELQLPGVRVGGGGGGGARHRARAAVRHRPEQGICLFHYNIYENVLLEKVLFCRYFHKNISHLKVKNNLRMLHFLIEHIVPRHK